MKTVALVFHKRVEAGKDAFNNPIYRVQDITVRACLIAPVAEPLSYREREALEQSRVQVRIHLPKAFTGDVGNSTVEWGGRVFRVDSDSVAFMDGNCPTIWNRYFRAEAMDE